MRLLLAALALACLGAAAGAQEEGADAFPGLLPPGGLVLFYNSSGPLSFVTATRRELPKGAVLLGEVRGRSCQYGISIPLGLSPNATSLSGAAGNGGFKKALEDIQKKDPEVIGIYDVKEDLHLTSILGIFRRLCTEVTAGAFANPATL